MDRLVRRSGMPNQRHHRVRDVLHGHDVESSAGGEGQTEGDTPAARLLGQGRHDPDEAEEEQRRPGSHGVRPLAHHDARTEDRDAEAEASSGLAYRHLGLELDPLVGIVERLSDVHLELADNA